MLIKDQTLLHCPTSAGGKEYLALLIDNLDGTFTAKSKYGPAGNLRAEAIQAANVSLEIAEKAYTKVIKSKQTGSSIYKIVSQSNPTEAVVVTPTREATSPYGAQLLNPIETESELISLFEMGGHYAQVKMDGDRMSILVGNGQMVAYNRKGQERDFPTKLKDQLQAISINGVYYIDGEIVNDTFYAFDLLQYSEAPNLADTEYSYRFSVLLDLEDKYKLTSDYFKIVHSIMPPLTGRRECITALLNRVKNESGEGVVLKDFSKPHSSGRPNSGGDQLKFKFVESSTCIVSKVNNQRSVGLQLLGQLGVPVDVGNVSIPPNQEIPAVGDLVEVRYLYAFDGGSLYQPVYLGKRKDLDRSECTLAQIQRYKPTQDSDLKAA